MSIFSEIGDEVRAVRRALLDDYSTHGASIVFCVASAYLVFGAANVITSRWIDRHFPLILWWVGGGTAVLVCLGAIFAVFYPKPGIEDVLRAKFVQRYIHMLGFGPAQLTRLDRSNDLAWGGIFFAGVGSYSVFGSTFYAPPVAFVLNVIQSFAIGLMIAFAGIGSAIGTVWAWSHTAGGGDSSAWADIIVAGPFVVLFVVGLFFLIPHWVPATFLLGMGACWYLLSWLPWCWNLRRAYAVPASVAEQYLRQSAEERRTCPWAQWIESPATLREMLLRVIRGLCLIGGLGLLTHHLGWWRLHENQKQALTEFFVSAGFVMFILLCLWIPQWLSEFAGSVVRRFRPPRS
jgi:hypothetical protein